MRNPLLSMLVCLALALASGDAEAKRKKGQKGKAAEKKADVEAPAAPADEKPAAPAEGAAEGGGEDALNPTAPEGFDDIKSDNATCTKDIASVCIGVIEGKGRNAACLRTHKDKVSEPCVKALYGFIKQRFMSVCKADMKKHCAAESKQQGKLMPCMIAAGEKLNDECGMVLGVKKPPAPAPAAAPVKK